MRKLISILATSLVLLASNTIVYASSIDLSVLSDVDTISHNCLFEQKYDESSHWNECRICKTKQNEANHLSKVSYTHSENSCLPDNKKIIGCSECGYSVSQDASKPHTFSYIHAQYGLYREDTYWVASHCSVCGLDYNMSYDGYKYFYDSSKTQEVDPSNVLINRYIYDQFGNRHYITWSCSFQKTDESLFDIQYSIENNSTLKITVTHIVPDEIKNKYTASQIANRTYIDTFIWISNLLTGSENKSEGYEPSQYSYNVTTGVMTYSYSLNLKSIYNDYATVGSIQPFVQYYDPSVNYNTFSKYNGVAVRVPVNLIDPTISSTIIN